MVILPPSRRFPALPTIPLSVSLMVKRAELHAKDDFCSERVSVLVKRPSGGEEAVRCADFLAVSQADPVQSR